MKILQSVLRKFSAIILVAIFLCPVLSFAQKPNPAIEAKVENLLKQLTLDEKISLIAGTGFDTVPIPRLGIPSLKMTDGPVGVRQAPATSFPSGIALAASFDPEMIQTGRAGDRRRKQKRKEKCAARSVRQYSANALWRQKFRELRRRSVSRRADGGRVISKASNRKTSFRRSNILPPIIRRSTGMTIDMMVDERTLTRFIFRRSGRRSKKQMFGR